MSAIDGQKLAKAGATTLETVQYLLKKGADPNAADPSVNITCFLSIQNKVCKKPNETLL